MGGNLFKLGRLPRAEYMALEAELRAWLDPTFGDLYRIPRAYGDKPDFGDVDIVLSEAAIETDWPDLRARICESLGVERFKVDGELLSTAYKGFQVDFFLRPEDAFLSTANFLCFNDLGNLIGKIARRRGLKYGERGLEYVFRRQDGHYRSDLPMCQDIGRILTFFDLDPADWHAGFPSLDAMFEWVVRSRWFSVEPYRSQSAATRKRHNERSTIQRFIAYLDAHHIEKTCDYGDDSAAHLQAALDAFPEAMLAEAIARERALEARDAIVREKFSGKLVMRLAPELEGQALGAFIRRFKASFEDFEAALVEMEAEEVERAILALAQSPWDEGDEELARRARP